MCFSVDCNSFFISGNLLEQLFKNLEQYFSAGLTSGTVVYVTNIRRTNGRTLGSVNIVLIPGFQIS